ncbi:MAG: hypothetical protein L0H53_06710, partial [Candidatus Nitrosocosmicus sp.]|nr:hypothetical protein [Candidatus Nitrosocosmicus sp.]
ICGMKVQLYLALVYSSSDRMLLSNDFCSYYNYYIQELLSIIVTLFRVVIVVTLSTICNR